MRSLAGHLLVASPQLPDENFYRTVVLIIHHDEQGAVGVVLNRPTGSTIREVWESLADEPCESDQPINIGGPVQGPLMAIHTNSGHAENEILPGVFFATHRDQLNEIVREEDQPFRIYNGYSGWAPGQLEDELKAGGWMVIPATYDHVFGDPETMWRQAAQEVGEHITAPLLHDVRPPQDPSCN
jgi:putative transcriptional regulator